MSCSFPPTEQAPEKGVPVSLAILSVTFPDPPSLFCFFVLCCLRWSLPFPAAKYDDGRDRGHQNEYFLDHHSHFTLSKHLRTTITLFELAG
jgi:hypothetical protein